MILEILQLRYAAFRMTALFSMGRYAASNSIFTHPLDVFRTPPSNGIARAHAYVAAGADMIFAEAVADLDSYRRFKAAVGVPILANITEFGMTPIFTKDELASADVDIVLYCCSAYRAMNLAALNVYETIRSTGTQRDAIPMMQTRNDMYGFLDYYAYEQKLDELFKGDKSS